MWALEAVGDMFKWVVCQSPRQQRRGWAVVREKPVFSSFWNVDSGGCGFSKRGDDRNRTRQGWLEVRGVSSGGRRSRWSSQASSSGLLRQHPTISPVRTTTVFLGVLNAETQSSDDVHENWFLQEGRPRNI